MRSFVDRPPVATWLPTRRDPNSRYVSCARVWWWARRLEPAQFPIHGAELAVGRRSLCRPRVKGQRLGQVVRGSGGIGSWATAMRVTERHGTDNMILLIADSKADDADLWRFVADSSRHLGLEPVIVADGRNPWQVFHDQRFLGWPFMS